MDVKKAANQRTYSSHKKGTIPPTLIPLNPTVTPHQQVVATYIMSGKSGDPRTGKRERPERAASEKTSRPPSKRQRPNQAAEGSKPPSSPTPQTFTPSKIPQIEPGPAGYRAPSKVESFPLPVVLPDWLTEPNICCTVPAAPSLTISTCTSGSLGPRRLPHYLRSQSRQTNHGQRGKRRPGAFPKTNKRGQIRSL